MFTILTATPDMLAQRYDTVGKPSDNVKVKIKDADQNGHGELLIKGVNVMNGYLYPSNLTDTFEDGFLKQVILLKLTMMASL